MESVSAVQITLEKKNEDDFHRLDSLSLSWTRSSKVQTMTHSIAATCLNFSLLRTSVRAKK